jgi:ribosomal protein L11 methyltransferase
MSAARFWELSVEAPEEVSEGLTNFAWELGALGVVEEEIAGMPRLRAFFGGATNVDALTARVCTYLEALRALGFTVPDDARLAPLADPGWAEAWRDHFRPRPVGDRLLIAPPWDAPHVPGRLTIVIEPGRAFGTGHHGSTAGCLEMLERIAGREAPACALDLGTGSGILAIAAARLGIARVLAVDDDPDAVANARANIALNGVGMSVTCTPGDAATLDAEPRPLVLANILATAHARLAPSYHGLVAPGGCLVLGGILEAEASETAETVERAGFARRATLVREGWATIELTRHP